MPGPARRREGRLENALTHLAAWYRVEAVEGIKARGMPESVLADVEALLRKRLGELTAQVRLDLLQSPERLCDPPQPRGVAAAQVADELELYGEVWHVACVDRDKGEIILRPGRYPRGG